MKPISSNEAVILVHGFLMGRPIMWYFSHELKKAGFDVFNLGYYSFGKSIEQMQEELFEKFQKINKSYSKIHFIGHSLGGLLIRSYLASNRISNLGNVVTLGSPNRGTEVVNTLEKSSLFSVLGSGAKELGTEHSNFLNSLEKPYFNLGVIAGDKDRKIYSKILKKANDGLVTVESTKVEGMSDFKILPVTHSGMLFNKEVVSESIHFLNNGYFKTTY